MEYENYLIGTSSIQVKKGLVRDQLWNSGSTDGREAPSAYMAWLCVSWKLRLGGSNLEFIQDKQISYLKADAASGTVPLDDWSSADVTLGVLLFNLDEIRFRNDICNNIIFQIFIHINLKRLNRIRLWAGFPPTFRWKEWKFCSATCVTAMALLARAFGALNQKVQILLVSESFFKKSGIVLLVAFSTVMGHHRIKKILKNG